MLFRAHPQGGNSPLHIQASHDLQPLTRLQKSGSYYDSLDKHLAFRPSTLWVQPSKVWLLHELFYHQREMRRVSFCSGKTQNKLLIPLEVWERKLDFHTTTQQLSLYPHKGMLNHHKGKFTTELNLNLIILATAIKPKLSPKITYSQGSRPSNLDQTTSQCLKLQLISFTGSGLLCVLLSSSTLLTVFSLQACVAWLHNTNGYGRLEALRICKRW